MEPKGREELIVAIVLASLILIIFAVFTLLFLLLFIKKKRVLQKEKEIMKANYEQTLLQSQIEIQEQTLRHISQEIHDNIGQVLSLVSLNLNTMDPGDAGKLLLTDELVAKALQDLRALSKSLNPERVQQVGIAEAIDNDLKILERTGKYKTRLDIEPGLSFFSPEKTVILYRMIQEVLTNIMKHAHADEIVVAFTESEQAYTISVSDNGRGFDTSQGQQNGIGLRNISQRAALIGAEMEIISTLQQGTAVSFYIKK